MKRRVILYSLALLFLIAFIGRVFFPEYNVVQSSEQIGERAESNADADNIPEYAGQESHEPIEPILTIPIPNISLGEIPLYSGNPYVEINGSSPFFDPKGISMDNFELYSPLDELKRCGVAFANLSKELMPTGERGSIGMIKPSGWHTIRYDDLIADRYLYNRCHLIAFLLAGENANPRNLITGTRYMNVEGMQPFEDLVASYIIRTGNHVLYRVTPLYDNNNLLANGVLMEAYSVEDNGAGICYNVFVYNVQPGIDIDYATGDSSRHEAIDREIDTVIEGYIGNVRSMKFHLPTCPNLPAEKNQVIIPTREEAIALGYSPCGNCKP